MSCTAQEVSRAVSELENYIANNPESASSLQNVVDSLKNVQSLLNTRAARQTDCSSYDTLLTIKDILDGIQTTLSSIDTSSSTDLKTIIDSISSSIASMISSFQSQINELSSGGCTTTTTTTTTTTSK